MWICIILHVCELTYNQCGVCSLSAILQTLLSYMALSKNKNEQKEKCFWAHEQTAIKPQLVKWQVCVRVNNQLLVWLLRCWLSRVRLCPTSALQYQHILKIKLNCQLHLFRPWIKKNKTPLHQILVFDLGSDCHGRGELVLQGGCHCMTQIMGLNPCKMWQWSLHLGQLSSTPHKPHSEFHWSDLV